jgi:hypothetical protein
MYNTRLILFTLLLCACISTVEAQDIPVSLQYEKHSLRIKHTPFKEVLVLDNRIDTLKIRTVKNGGFPLLYEKIAPSCAFAVKNYFDAALTQLTKGGETLLIDIRQLRTSNIAVIARRKRKGSGTIARNSGGSILFAADLYAANANGTYRKLVSIDKDYSSNEGSENTIRHLLNEALEAVSSTAHHHSPKDLAYFNYTTDSTVVSFNQVNTHTLQRWQQYNILIDTVVRNGSYLNFDDFRDNMITPKEYKLAYNELDSTYFITGEKHKRYYEYPYAVAFDGKLYVLIDKNKYLELARENSTFSFRIPYSLPDMHTTLSLQAVQVNHSSSALPSTYSGNAWIDVVAIVLGLVIDGVIRSSENKMVAQQKEHIMYSAVTHDFRSCTIDMNCGDFMY